jgi:indolepyruvate ferredoxin oxidoreductase alpha subunit
MNKVLTDKIGEKVLLLGNEAIVRGALESGIGLVATYPGTPSSEIGDTFADIAKDVGVYFEYSTNEKVALEVAAGAALSGVRSMVFFKHFGLNVASDSLFPLAYSGVKAGMVVLVADDPQGWSSGQSEEDSRLFIL